MTISNEAVLHFIAGAERPSASERTFLSQNPANGETLAEVAFGGPEDVDGAVDAAWAAFDSAVWRDLRGSEKARTLRRLARLIEERVDDIARIEALDVGKPLTAARGDVMAAVSLLEYFATLPENIHGRVYTDEKGYFTYSRREPYGVVAAIAPWNFPFLLAAWKTAPALAVGNSVVLKMAEQTPISTSIYARLCHEAGIPGGVVNVVHGDGSTTGAALVRHPRVRKVTFTGSTEVGRAILGASADGIKSCHLELGGKSPNIVLRDADLDQAVTGSLFTTFFNSGQICTSGSRLPIDEAVADDFLERFRRRAHALRIGDPLDADTQLGPLVSQDQLDRVQGYIESGVEAGATLVMGGSRLRPPGLEHGYFIEPTVFGDVEPHMKIAQEEIFGPVLAVLRFKTEDQAISLANDVAYGLAATVWTTGLNRAFLFAEQLEAGIVWTNCPHHLQWNIPYEGHKHSGLGEDLGLEAINTFTQLKVNYINFTGDAYQWA